MADLTTEQQRELLELAALACGYEVARVADDGKSLLLVGVQEPWNPLTSTADRYELARKCKMQICFFLGVVEGHCGYGEYTTSRFGDDESSEARAIVEVAAEIGRRMKENGE